MSQEGVKYLKQVASGEWPTADEMPLETRAMMTLLATIGLELREALYEIVLCINETH